MSRLVWLLVIVAGVLLRASPQDRAAPEGVRLYIFDNGTIAGVDPKLFNFAPGELREPDVVTRSYLIVHPRGTVMFDSGAIPDSRLRGEGSQVVEGAVSASRPLLPQLAAAGFSPADITYFALSHYHSDHTANANAFAGSTWIVQKAERDYMFSDRPTGIIQRDTFSALRNAKTRILDNEDLDIFGDGTVVIKFTPGHTPGHQALFVRLPAMGPVLLAGDLYHYPEERAQGKVPTFDFDADLTRASRLKVEAFLKETGAALWMEHDRATHATLPLAPAFVR